MAKKKIILVEGDKHFGLIENYINADENDLPTPEHVLQDEFNRMMDKIKSLVNVSSIIENKEVKLVLEEKIAAYKDASQSLLYVVEKINQFKMEIKQ